MACSPMLFSVSVVVLILLLPHSTKSTSDPPPACEKRYCGSSQLAIEFPFQLLTEQNSVENIGCGHKGFEVSCTEKNQSLISLPNAGKFVIKAISMESQQFWINDPDNCLAKRFLQKETIDLNDSPFSWGNSPSHVTFYNCTESERNPSVLIDPQLIVPCLSHHNQDYSVVVILDGDEDHGSGYSSWCKNIGSAMIPVTNLLRESRQIRKELVYSDIMLQWCFCRADQQYGLSSSDHNSSEPTGHDKDGISPPPPGHMSKLVSTAWGISMFLFFIWILLSAFGTVRCRCRQWMMRRSNSDERAIPHVIGRRFDNNRSMIDIEQCPKMQLSERVELSKSIDNVCSICLSEYEKDDTLRSMPRCKHYFHAHCIDAWFKMNATCPLCRNFPL